MDSTTTTGKAYRLLVVALVVAVAVQPMLGAALASSASTSTTASAVPDDCRNSFTEAFLETLTLRAQPLVDEGECKAQELVANATWADIYASGLAQADLGKAGRTPVLNHLNDSKTFARTIVKSTAVKAFNNGTSKSQIKAKVNDSVEEYYAPMHENLISTHNANLNQLWYIWNTEANNSVDSVAVTYLQNDNRPFDYSQSGPSGKLWDKDAYTPDWELRTLNATLVDGSTTNMSALWLSDGNYWIEPTQQHPDTYTNGRSFHYFATDPTSNVSNDLVMNRSNSVVVYDHEEYADAFERINQTAEDVKVNAEKYVDGLFATYNQSQGINVSEVLDPITLSSQWNTNYESTGYHGWMAAEIGLTGLEGNISSSFAINYTPAADQLCSYSGGLNGSGNRSCAFTAGNTTQMDGTLMTDWAPSKTNGSFVRNQTYDTSNANVSVLFVEQVTANRSRLVRLNGTFEVYRLTNVQTGETLNATELEEQNQQTWEENSTVEQLRSLLEYRNRSVTINEGETTVQPPSGDGLFTNISPLGAGIGGLVALGAVVIIGKELAS